MKIYDFGTNFGAHFLLALLVFFGRHFFWDGVKHKKGRILDDVGWRKTQEGRISNDVSLRKTQEGKDF